MFLSTSTNGAPYASELLTTMTTPTSFTAAVYNRAPLPVELLTNGTLTSGTGWTAGAAANHDDWTIASDATYTHANGAGYISQAVTALAKTGRAGAWYRFQYTVSDSEDAAPVFYITTTFAASNTTLSGIGTDGTHFVDFQANKTAPGAFTIEGTSAAAGVSTLDALSLKELEQSPYLQPLNALVTVRTASILFTLDGTTPTTLASTANWGHQADAGQSFVLSSIEEIKQFKAINSVNGNGAVVFATFYYV